MIMGPRMDPSHNCNGSGLYSGPLEIGGTTPRRREQIAAFVHGTVAIIPTSPCQYGLDEISFQASCTALVDATAMSKLL